MRRPPGAPWAEAIPAGNHLAEDADRDDFRRLHAYRHARAHVRSGGALVARGSITKRVQKSGAVSWVAVFDVPSIDGRRRQTGARPDARRGRGRRQRRAHAANRGELVADTGVTFDVFSERWLAEHRAASRGDEDRLREHAREPPRAVLRPPRAGEDHARPCPRVRRRQAGRHRARPRAAEREGWPDQTAAVREDDQQPGHAARADPRPRRRGRADRPQPGGQQGHATAAQAKTPHRERDYLRPVEVPVYLDACSGSGSRAR